MPDAETLTAPLDKIRLRREQSERGGLWRPTVAQLDAAQDDVSKLLAVVDAVLALANEWQQEATDLDQRAERSNDTRRSAHLFVRAQGCEDHSRALSDAITRTLAGEDNTDA